MSWAWIVAAGAALVVAGKSSDLKHGVAAAQTAIDSGAAEAALAALLKVSNS